MGESHQKRLEMQKALANGTARPQPNMNLMQAFVLMQLDLACAVLTGIAHCLGNQLKQSEPADEIQLCINRLAAYRVSYLRATTQKLVIAQPGDVPTPPRVA